MNKSRYVAEVSFAKDGNEFNSYLMRKPTVHKLFLSAVYLGVSAIKTDAYLSDVPNRDATFSLKDEQIQEAQHLLKKQGVYSYEATDWFNVFIVDTKFNHKQEAKKLVADFDNTSPNDDAIAITNFWGKRKPVINVKAALTNPDLVLF